MTFKLKHITYALITSGALLGSNLAFAADAEIEALRKTIEELDQKIKIIERKNEIAAEDAAAAKKTTPVLVAGENGFALQSADKKFQYALKGLIQFDHRDYNQDALSPSDGFTARRIRPTFQGTLFGKYDFRFTPEFGEVNNRTADPAGNNTRVVDAYVDARIDPAFKIRVGKAKPFVGLERLQSGGDIKFIERSYVSSILPNRALGVSIYGDVLDEKLSYAVGVFNSAPDGSEDTTKIDTNSDKDYAARIFATPFKGSDSVLEGLGVGIAGTYTDSAIKPNSGVNTNVPTNEALPSYRTAGQLSGFAYANTGFDGKRTRISPQAYYYNGPLGIIAEYARSSQEVTGTGTLATNGGKQDTLKNTAWQITGSWLLTGEDAGFKSPKPKRPFETGKEGWGAWELVARYQELNIDDDTFSTGAGAGTRFADPRSNIKEAKTWGIGVNWYLNQWVRLGTNYEVTKFDGGGNITNIGGATGSFTNIRDRDDEKILFTRLQFQF